MWKQRRPLKPKPTVPLIVRFWRKVAIGEPDECWLWTAGTDGDGYGKIWVQALNRSTGAHRVSWFLSRREWPAPGEVIRHTCDNPPCVNPAHLLTGTHKDNYNDCVDRGRIAKAFTANHY